jgi:SAM-dependent methyltransferase
VKQYPREFGIDGSHGHCHRLLARSGLTGGLVLDLGCSTGPLAEPVSDLGFEYVGVDIEDASVAAVTARGFEAHVLDLAGDEDALERALGAVVGARRLAAVLLLDVIEHLVDPGPLLRAVARLDDGLGGVHVIVSIPNASHVDVGIKLLLGRWDLTKIGLLDDTHVRFYNERLVREVLAGGGWVEADADDVVNAFSDQLFPADAPALRPGAPLRQVLWRVRMEAAPHGETYQFVRRFVHDAAAAAAVPRAPVYDVIPDDGENTFLTVVVGPCGEPAASAAVLRDLAAQATDDFEVVVVGDADAAAVAGLEVPVTVLAPPDPAVGDWRDAAVAAATTRYVSFVDDTSRLAPGYVETVKAAADALPGRVVQSGAAAAPAAALAGRRDDGFDAVRAEVEPLALEPLDLATTVAFGPLVVGAHAVPREACATDGLRFHPGDPEAAASLFLMRAVEMCGIVRTSECVTVVDESTVRDLAKDVEFVGADLDRTPMILPEGGGSQLLAMRTMIAALLPQRDELAARIEALTDQVTALSSLVRQRDADLSSASAEARSLRSRINRRVTTRVKRKLGRTLRRI